MPYRISELEIDRVSALPASERYEHFLKRVADWEEVWSLKDPTDGGWRVAAASAGKEAVPVWPHPEYAARLAVGEWIGSEPALIALADWIEAWLPGLERDGRMVAVFPVPQRGAIEVDPQRLAKDLDAALADYE